MNSKDKDNKSLQDKLKNYFKSKNSTGGNFPSLVHYGITAEVERDISAASSHYKRIKTLKELESKVLSVRLETHGVERIWKTTKDLVSIEQPRDSRHFALGFFRSLVQGQFEELGIMRTVIFNFIMEHELSEDTEPRFKLLQTLTDNGKNIQGFEEEIGRFLLDWLAKLEFPSLIQEFLELIVNVVKYNAAYLDDDIVEDIVNHCCYLCCYSGSADAVLTCLQVLETAVCYTVFPPSVLGTFVAALCRSVNSAPYCQLSWKIMRNMLGTDLGHAALNETVNLLSSGGAGDPGLTRGAVFYINMALWSTKRVSTLRATPTSVLPAFLVALEGGHAVVTYEVVLALQNLVSVSDLHEAAWGLVFRILRTVITQLETSPNPNKMIESQLHELITTIETLNEQRLYHGDVGALYALVDTCGYTRPESSVMKLINWRVTRLTPAHPDWLGGITALLERYCRQEKRTAVRLHTLQVVYKLILIHRSSHEEELLERVVLPHTQQSAQDADTEVRLLTARLIVDLALVCQAKSCGDLLNVAAKILNRPFDLYVECISLPPDAKTVADIRCVTDGLIKIFHHKLLHLPSAHAVKTYIILLEHMEKHYNRPSLFQHHPYIRLKILELFLSARANRYCHIGFCYDAQDRAVLGAAALREKPVFSPYVCVEGGTAVVDPAKGPHSPNSANNQSNISYVSIRKACKLVVTCLSQERDWSVLSTVLREIPNVMQNKPLILSKQNNDIDMLASALCAMMSNGNMAEQLHGAKLTNSDYNGHVLSVLASLAPYHAHLEPQTQQKIVKCLIKCGLVLRTPQQCIAALTIYTLETRDTMVKLLPEVLLKLSQISDTTQIAVPILEFLSTLTRLPKMFASFVADQYMSVFAILLPYTNPSRYSHYVVSLAHHVIAAWFLKCRLHYRKNFVQFIVHGLHNYILLPFEEAKFNRSVSSTLSNNEDSSNRMRSSGLGSKGREPLSRSALGGGGGNGGGGGGNGGGELGARSATSTSATFHHELTEVCVDLMARYTFSPCSVRPRRSPAAEFMLSGGQSCTWVVGHEVVTITTSGCQQNSLRNGLCDRCQALCKQHTESTPSDCFLSGNSDSDKDPSAEIKRQNSSETRSGCSEPPAADDAQAQLSSRLENLAKQEERGGCGGEWWRGGAGACVCWCAGWAEVHVRRPTGDVSWVMRMQNQMSFDSMAESPLNDVISVLAPSVQAARAPGDGSRSSGLGDSCLDALCDLDPRSRSGSASSQHKSTQYSPAATPGAAPDAAPDPPAGPAELYKSSSDGVVVAADKKPPHASTHCIVPAGQQVARAHVTEPIDIPGSPQRQSSTSTNTDDEDTVFVSTEHLPGRLQSKSRHPVRRSNSSPEMSSWKLTAPPEPSPPASPRPASPAASQAHHEMILLPGVEPAAPLHHHQKKGGKNKDMRVSCEAIPEEMLSSGGTPPSLAAHPHLLTFNSDPGEQEAAAASSAGMPTVASDTALNTLASKSEARPGSHKAPEPRAEPKVAWKPPAPPSPGRAVRPAPAKPGVALKLLDPDRDDLPPLSRSKRSNTISVMSPTRKRKDNPSPKSREGRPGGGGVTPAFVLLQLYHNMSVAQRAQIAQPSGSGGGAAAGEWVERPLLVSGVQHERSVKNLDHIPPLETYRVGVLYVGPGQTEETQILRNEFGSIRYGEFLRELGTLIAVEDAEKHGLYLNIERGGRDGHFAYVWQDDIMQVHFHVATLMPNSASDPTANEKRKHIGNDYVSIVYNDSGVDFNINTIKGQFNFCIVMIEPLEHGINRVTVKTKEGRIDRKFLLGGDCKVISDLNVALLARQLALHCTLASLISRSLTDSKHVPYASNSLERLRVIKRLRARLIQERASSQESSLAVGYVADSKKRLNMDDFTEYT